MSTSGLDTSSVLTSSELCGDVCGHLRRTAGNQELGQVRAEQDTPPAAHRSAHVQWDDQQKDSGTCLTGHCGNEKRELVTSLDRKSIHREPGQLRRSSTFHKIELHALRAAREQQDGNTNHDHDTHSAENQPHIAAHKTVKMTPLKDTLNHTDNKPDCRQHKQLSHPQAIGKMPRKNSTLNSEADFLPTAGDFLDGTRGIIKVEANLKSKNQTPRGLSAKSNSTAQNTQSASKTKESRKGAADVTTRIAPPDGSRVRARHVGDRHVGDVSHVERIEQMAAGRVFVPQACLKTTVAYRNKTSVLTPDNSEADKSELTRDAVTAPKKIPKTTICPPHFKIKRHDSNASGANLARDSLRPFISLKTNDTNDTRHIEPLDSHAKTRIIDMDKIKKKINLRADKRNKPRRAGDHKNRAVVQMHHAQDQKSLARDKFNQSGDQVIPAGDRKYVTGDQTFRAGGDGDFSDISGPVLPHYGLSAVRTHAQTGGRHSRLAKHLRNSCDDVMRSCGDVSMNGRGHVDEHSVSSSHSDSSIPISRADAPPTRRHVADVTSHVIPYHNNIGALDQKNASNAAREGARDLSFPKMRETTNISRWYRNILPVKAANVAGTSRHSHQRQASAPYDNRECLLMSPLLRLRKRIKYDEFVDWNFIKAEVRQLSNFQYWLNDQITYLRSEMESLVEVIETVSQFKGTAHSDDHAHREEYAAVDSHAHGEGSARALTSGQSGGHPDVSVISLISIHSVTNRVTCSQGTAFDAERRRSRRSLPLDPAHPPPARVTGDRLCAHVTMACLAVLLCVQLLSQMAAQGW